MSGGGGGVSRQRMKEILFSKYFNGICLNICCLIAEGHNTWTEGMIVCGGILSMHMMAIHCMNMIYIEGKGRLVYTSLVNAIWICQDFYKHFIFYIKLLDENQRETYIFLWFYLMGVNVINLMICIFFLNFIKL